MEVRLTGPIPLGEQLPCTDLMVNTTCDDGAFIITGMGEGDGVGCHMSGHHAPPHGPLITRERGATYHYRWPE